MASNFRICIINFFVGDFEVENNKHFTDTWAR